MSVILQFPVNRVSSRNEFDMVLPGEVVIFPGVRVERRNFEGSKPVRSQKRRASQAAIDEDMA
jgi:hypothetical protein